MTRGDLVTVALQGDYGKPRPALIIRSDLFADHPSVTILPITGELRETALFRITLDPTDGNGLRKRSQVMVDKVQTVDRARIGPSFGRIEDTALMEINRAFLLWVGMA